MAILKIPFWPQFVRQTAPTEKVEFSSERCFYFPDRVQTVQPVGRPVRSKVASKGSWSLIEAGVSATQRETTQTNEFQPYPFLLVNAVIFNSINQRQTLSTHNTNRYILSRTLLRFCGTTFVQTALFPPRKPRRYISHKPNFRLTVMYINYFFSFSCSYSMRKKC